MNPGKTFFSLLNAKLILFARFLSLALAASLRCCKTSMGGILGILDPVFKHSDVVDCWVKLCEGVVLMYGGDVGADDDEEEECWQREAGGLASHEDREPPGL